jgi:hypothetical protein
MTMKAATCAMLELAAIIKSMEEPEDDVTVDLITNLRHYSTHHRLDYSTAASAAKIAFEAGLPMLDRDRPDQALGEFLIGLRAWVMEEFSASMRADRPVGLSAFDDMDRVAAMHYQAESPQAVKTDGGTTRPRTQSPNRRRHG